MAKFYVSCGSQSLIISAPTAEFAAMRLMDEAMAAHVWIYEDANLSEQDRRDHLVLEALLHLDPAVQVSEVGLSHNEAGQFEVPLMLEKWHRLMTGLSRLFDAAGLTPRRILPEIVEPSFNPNHAASRRTQDFSSSDASTSTDRLPRH